MSDSILTSVKTALGILPGATEFDDELIIHINSVLGILTQEGLGPAEGYAIESDQETYEDFLGTNKMQLSLAKLFVPLKVRLAFDPPMNSGTTEALTKRAEELEYRLYMTENPKKTFETSESSNNLHTYEYDDFYDDEDSYEDE